MLEQRDGEDRHLYKGDGGKESWTRSYLCHLCVATERGLTPEGSLAYILENRPGHQKRLTQNAEYNFAVGHLLEEFQGMSRGKLHMIARGEIAKVLAPLATFEARKARVLGRRTELLSEHAIAC